jgi:hypothetical protein
MPIGGGLKCAGASGLRGIGMAGLSTGAGIASSGAWIGGEALGASRSPYACCLP